MNEWSRKIEVYTHVNLTIICHLYFNENKMYNVCADRMLADVYRMNGEVCRNSLAMRSGRTLESVTVCRLEYVLPEDWIVCFYERLAISTSVR